MFCLPKEQIIRWWEKVFTSLRAGWYNWAVSSSLREVNNYTWSTVMALYSTHCLGTSLIHLVKGVGEGKEEERLQQFLDNREMLAGFYLNSFQLANQPELRKFFLEKLSLKTGLSFQNLDKKIRFLGNLLKLGSVSNLEKLEERLLIQINSRLLENIVKANLTIVDLIKFTIENYPPEERYLILLYLQEEVKELNKILKKEKVNYISYWDFNHFIKELDGFIHSQITFLKEIELPLMSEQQRGELRKRDNNPEMGELRNNLSFVKDWEFA